MGRGASETSEKILAAARALVREVGPDRLTFDAVADRVGISKQAVIYWFPNKARLVEALVRPALEAESEAGIAAVRDGCESSAAIRDFVTGCRFCQRMGREGPTLGERPPFLEVAENHWVEACPECYQG